MAPQISDMIFGIAEAAAKVARMPKVYPAYIVSRIRDALRQKDLNLADHDQIITSVGVMETIGDCRYAQYVTDHNGTTYRVTVEVLKAAQA